VRLEKAIELINRFAECPKCGCDKIGADAGGIEIEGDLFRRFCGCGWEVGFRDKKSEN
jgi:hypothetical protein